MFDTVEAALAAFRLGQPIILVDDEDRENEGDIVFPASMATQERINFCATHARGLVCIAMHQKIADQIGLTPVKTNHADPFHTAFYDSIDAIPAFGITTGISAKERAITAQRVVHPAARPTDFIKPGHLFPVVAKEGGILVRKGHTEAAVDLCLLADLPPAAIICEIMNEEGDMLRRTGLIDFAKKHALKMISIQQLLDFRKAGLNLSEQTAYSNNRFAPSIQLVATSKLPTEFGEFKIAVYQNLKTTIEHVVVFMDKDKTKQPILRFHSECLTGDVFGSLKCDCRAQLTHALKAIHAQGHGYVVYLKGQEGRGIGIGNKIAAYDLQDQGQNTYQANLSLGLPAENRQYQDAIEILKVLDLAPFKFITNNPDKLSALKEAGFHFEQLIVPAFVTAENKNYLSDKARIANHNIIF